VDVLRVALGGLGAADKRWGVPAAAASDEDGEDS
jgi:hypothetical protein